VERELARRAQGSHGVVTRRELLEAGITPAEIEWRLNTGALLREYSGVYRVGHRAPSLEARYLAAVRACGDGAVLSGKPAAFLYELTRGTPPRPEVTTRSQRRVRGVVTRRSRMTEAATFRGIPVTTVPQALVDLAAHLRRVLRGDERVTLSKLESRFLALVRAGTTSGATPTATCSSHPVRCSRSSAP